MGDKTGGRMSQSLENLAGSVSQAQNLEQLTRPMLQLLEKITNLESTYLTIIDEMAGVQRILYARNTGDLQIPEGLSVPWSDTLCKRALEEKSFLTTDVPACWGDSEAARALGLKTYLSAAVYTDDGALYGTLCGASAESVDVDPDVSQVLELFSRLISQQASREKSARLATERADIAESKARDMQFVAEIGAMCLSSKDMPVLLRNMAKNFLMRSYWSSAVPFIVEGASTQVLEAGHENFAPLLNGLLAGSAKDGGYQPVFLKGSQADPDVQQQLQDTGHPRHSLLFLMTAAMGDELLGGVLLIGNEEDISESEQAMMQSCWHTLTLYAERHREHELLEAANAQLTLYARHDPLTDLPNRRYLVEEMSRMLGHAARTGETVYVAFIDLDGFKKINDEYGHDAGDDFLQEIALRLKRTARAGDLPARYGGDEFVLVGVNHEEQTDSSMAAIADRIGKALSGNFDLPTVALRYPGPSVGVVGWHGSVAPDADKLLAKADQAMYVTKLHRRVQRA